MARKKSLLSREAKAAIKNAKKQSKLIHKKQVKEMRPYLSKLRDIDLRKELTSGQKSYVTKAWNEYQALTLRPTKIFRTRNKKKLETVQKASQHVGKVKFDVAFIPTADQHAKVSVKGDKLIISSRFVDEIKIPFNMKALATDPEKEIRRVMDENPEYQQFVLMCGEYIWNGGISRGRVIDRIVPHLMRYIPGGEGYEKRGPNSHFLNWAVGLRGYKAKEQRNIEDYLRAYHRAKDAKKKENNRKRRQRAKEYGKKF